MITLDIAFIWITGFIVGFLARQAIIIFQEYRALRQRFAKLHQEFKALETEVIKTRDSWRR